jgi:chromosome segregation protein
MKLRRIDILGFKSFRNRTALEIADGVTSVVGPNGCGKSNIVDAIRWSIGSQSAKDLRGRAMEDVIFAGSDSQRPMGLAEVSLILENDGQNLPGIWREVPEVKITRRLYRTGESEYEINGETARLRDIHEIFLGTGVGAKEAYSIIEQGRIGFIVSARPEERRIIIEEAAGITRYKFQRKTAERRLDKTRENLTRVKDILAEVSRQLASLERQAKRAAQVRELAVRRRILELTRAVERREKVNLSLQEQLRLLETLAVASREATNALRIADTQLESLRVEHAVQERTLAAATEEFYRIRSRAELLASNVSFQQRELEQLAAREQGVQGEVAARTAQLERSQLDLRDEQARAQELAASASEAADDVLTRADSLEEERAKLQEANDESRTLSNELTQLRGQIARATGRLETSQSETGRLKERTESLAEDESRLQTELAALLRVSAEARDRREHTADRAAAMTDRLDEARAAESLLLRELETVRTNTRAVRNRLRSTEVELDGLTASMNSGKGAADGPRRLLNAARDGRVSGVVGSLASCLSVVDGQDGVVATLLGSWADAVLVATPVDALAVGRWAREQGVALTLLHLAEPWQGTIDGLCSTQEPVPMCVAERLRSAESVENVFEWTPRSPSARAVDVSRGARSSEGVRLRGSARSAAEVVFALGRNIETTNALLKELSAEEMLASARESDMESSLESAMQVRAALAEEMQLVTADLATVSRQLDEAERSALTCRRSLERVEQERASLDGRRVEIVTAGEAITEELRGAESRIQELDGRADAVGQRVVAMQDEVQRLADQVALARERASGLNAQRGENGRTIERLNGELKDHQSRIISLRTEAQALTSRTDEVRENLVADSSGRVEAEEARALAEKDLAVLREKYDRVATDLRNAEAGQMEKRRGADLAAETFRRGESGVERTRSELELADQSMLERFEVSIFDARREALTGGFTDDMDKELADVATRMDRIGPVNPAAEEEYAEAAERHTFLSTQKDDLDAALADLEAAIRKMDKTSRELFEEMFHAVNERFQVIFPKLFNGGKARLELTDPSNMLETGIDIIVQPPGKRLQSMTLMSGGEKALSAVALIFAIFQLRPTPFCVLDEVDAPLDEANVMRFAELVVEMSGVSQFIIITHNKRTMEAAHTLYGVTMEEPGVSKVVGVKLPGREQTQLPVR